MLWRLYQHHVQSRNLQASSCHDVQIPWKSCDESQRSSPSQSIRCKNQAFVTMYAVDVSFAHNTVQIYRVSIFIVSPTWKEKYLIHVILYDPLEIIGDLQYDDTSRHDSENVSLIVLREDLQMHAISWVWNYNIKPWSVQTERKLWKKW